MTHLQTSNQPPPPSQCLSLHCLPCPFPLPFPPLRCHTIFCSRQNSRKFLRQPHAVPDSLCVCVCVRVCVAYVMAPHLLVFHVACHAHHAYPCPTCSTQLPNQFQYSFSFPLEPQCAEISYLILVYVIFICLCHPPPYPRPATASLPLLQAAAAVTESMPATVQNPQLLLRCYSPPPVSPSRLLSSLKPQQMVRHKADSAHSVTNVICSGIMRDIVDKIGSSRSQSLGQIQK